VRRTSRHRSARPYPPGFATIWTTVALDLVGFGIVLPILPLYAEDFGASPTTIGILLASFSIAQLVCAPIWGRVSDHVGRKPVLIVSLFGTALGSFLTGAAGSLWLLFVGRILDGASGASVSVAQAAVTDVAEPDDRPRLLGLLGAAFGLGFVAGPALGALAALEGPHVPFYLASALALGNAVVAIRRLPETRPARHAPVVAGDPVIGEGVEDVAVDDSAGDPLGVELHDPQSPPGDLLRLAVIGFLAVVAFSGFEATFSLFVARRFDLGISATGGLFAAIGLALVLVQGGLIRPAVAWLGTKGTLRVGLGVNMLALGVLGVASTWPVLVAALLGLVVGQGFVTPTLAALVANRARVDRRGAALGFQQLAGGLGRVVGPASAARLFDFMGVPAPFVAGAVVALAALLLALADRWSDEGLEVHGQRRAARPVPAAQPSRA